jgi:hypothetical protein
MASSSRLVALARFDQGTPSPFVSAAQKSGTSREQLVSRHGGGSHCIPHSHFLSVAL